MLCRVNNAHKGSYSDKLHSRTQSNGEKSGPRSLAVIYLLLSRADSQQKKPAEDRVIRLARNITTLLFSSILFVSLNDAKVALLLHSSDKGEECYFRISNISSVCL
jgi:hypothetical protein